jgi:hypothetical protein
MDRSDSLPNRKDLRLTLLENGLDFIASGLRHLRDDQNPKTVKYAVLRIAAGIELVFKARLEMEDPAQLFDAPAKFDQNKYQRGDFFSCRWQDCLSRLESSAGIELEPMERREVETLISRRNKLQHFRLDEPIEALKSVVIRGMNVVFDFLGQHFEQNSFGHEEDALLAEIRLATRSLQAFREHRCAQLDTQLGPAFVGIVCPVCGEGYLVPDVDVNCRYCHFRGSAEVAAERYVSDVLRLTIDYCGAEGIDYPIHDCRYCDNPAMVVDPDDGTAICFSCGTAADGRDVRVCPNCGKASDPEHFVGDQCSDCFDDYVNQDHT